MKKIAVFLLTAILLTSFFGTSSFAAVPSDSLVQPLWTNTMTFDTCFSIDDTTNVKSGCASMSVNGDFGVDRIEGEIMIYRSTSDGQWIPYRSVTKTMYTNFFDVEVTFNCMTYVSYKAAFSATVYKNGVAETITNNLYDTCH